MGIGIGIRWIEKDPDFRLTYVSIVYPLNPPAHDVTNCDLSAAGFIPILSLRRSNVIYRIYTTYFSRVFWPLPAEKTFDGLKDFLRRLDPREGYRITSLPDLLLTSELFVGTTILELLVSDVSLSAVDWGACCIRKNAWIIMSP